MVPSDGIPETALESRQLALELKSFERLERVRINFGQPLGKCFGGLPQLTELVVPFFAHPAADQLLLSFGKLCDRKDVGVAATLDDVFCDPLELLEELLGVGNDHSARSEGDRTESSEASPGRHSTRARSGRETPGQDQPSGLAGSLLQRRSTSKGTGTRL